MLYKASDKVKTSVEIKQDGDKLHLLFSADCGKFGTDEILDSYELTTDALLSTLQASAVEEDADNAPLQRVIMYVCPDCENPYPHKYANGGGLCEECGFKW